MMFSPSAPSLRVLAMFYGRANYDQLNEQADFGSSNRLLLINIIPLYKICGHEL